jgi:protein involved in polysaccharide export with SLBB domain
MKLIARIFFASSLLPAILIFTGCRLTGEADNPENSQVIVTRFQIGDTVTVVFSGLPTDLPAHMETIKEDGDITLDFVGKIQAVGKTAGELQNEIHDLYVPKLFTHLTVTVNTGDRVYYVRGEVKGPGRQLYVGETTVSKAITSAGDFTDFADHSKVWLIHNGKRIRVDCDRVFEGKDPDPAVYPNDQIEVARRWF